MQLILQGKILNPTSLNLLLTPCIPQMTMGLHVRHHGGMPVYHKEGGGAGCHSSIHFRPHQHLAACVISGDAEFDVNGLLDELLDSVADSRLPKVNVHMTTMDIHSENKDVLLHTKSFTVPSSGQESNNDDNMQDSLHVLTDKPILLLHGGPGVPDYLEEMAQLLLTSKFCSQVVCFDQRGVGKSKSVKGITKISMKLMVSDIECIRKAYGMEQVHLMGHSWGGALAQYYAMNCPERVASMALISPTALSQGSEWSTMEKEVFMFNVKKAGWIPFLKMGLASLAMQVPSTSFADFGAREMMRLVMKNYYADPATAPDPTLAFLDGVSAHACFETKRAFLQDVSSPMMLPKSISSRCLVTFGERDIYGEQSKTLFSHRFDPNEIHLISNSCHLPWIDQPDELIRLLSNFYATQKSSEK
jgi:proline iminopeptidase